MKEQYVCHSCETKYDVTEFRWNCKCGGMLDLVKEKIEIDFSMLRKSPETMWR
jgi:threonine synthase